MSDVIIPYGPTLTEWSTALPDWKSRIVREESLMPVGPLNKDYAQFCMDFFSKLVVADILGQPTIEECCRPWIMEFARAIFGAYDPFTARRLIRYFMLCVAKKNAKSTIAAGIMLTSLWANHRESGEFYILAPTIEVAQNSFIPARDMVRKTEGLSEIFKVTEHTRTIEDLNTRGTLKIIAADSETVGGKKAIGVLVDELWLFGKKSGSESMLTEATGGLTSRPEGFVIYLTTHSDQAPVGVMKDRLDHFRSVRDGKKIDRRSLGLFYEYPEEMLKDDSFREEENWYISNPNLGASVDREFVRDQYDKAENGGKSKFDQFAAKHLNVEIGVGTLNDGWAGAEHWEKGIDPTFKLTLDWIIENCEVIAVGIDGGGLDDLLGLSVVGRHKISKKWYAWQHAYISPQGMQRRKNNETQYQGFIEDGDLTLVENLPDDITALVEIVKKIYEAGLLACVGVDMIGLGGITDALSDIGVTEENGTLRAISQGIGLAGTFKTIERKLVDGTFIHDGSRLMKWCAGNAKVKATATSSRIERGESGQGKIDPLAAMMDACTIMCHNPEPMGQFQMMFFEPVVA